MTETATLGTFPWDPSLPKRRLSLDLGHVVYTEAGSGTPVIFLHGYGDELFTWRHQLHDLRALAHLYALDLIGYGFSDKPPLAYTVNTFMDCVRQFMDGIDVERATLVGSSMGAAVALCFAKRHPARVARLALLGPTIPGVQPAGRFSFLVFWLAHHQRLGKLLLRPRCKAAIRLGLQHNVADPQLITDEVVRYYLQFPRSPGFPHAYLSTARHWPEWMRERPRLGELKMPVLLIWGADDRVHPIRQATLLQTLIPQAQLLRLPACGHLPHSEQPALVNSALRAFLQNERIVAEVRLPG